MTLSISHTTFDSLDACAQSRFWAQVLDFHEDPGDPNRPGDDECMIFSPDGTQRLLFISVPDSKQVKNRVHLDLQASEPCGRDRELQRLLALGAAWAAQPEDARPREAKASYSPVPNAASKEADGAG